MKIIDAYRFGGGVTNQSILLNGSTQYGDTGIDLAALLAISGNNTINIWFKRNGNPAATEYLWSNTSNPTNTYYRCYVNTSGRINFYVRNVGTRGFVTTTASFCDNAWHYVSCVRTAAFADLKIYVDGVLQTVTVNNAGNGSFSNAFGATLGIGSIDGTLSPGGFFGGYLDGLSGFAAAFTLSEVNEAMGLIDQTTHSQAATLYFDYEFNTGQISGATITDLQGTSNATLYNSPAISTDVPI